VVLEEGANFRGNIDMQPRSGKQVGPAKS